MALTAALVSPAAAREAPPARVPSLSLGELIGQARAALDGGRWDEAERLARRAIERDSNSAEAFRIAGLAAFRQRKWDEARAAFAEEVARDSPPAPGGSRVAWFNLAGAEFKLERYADAEKDYLVAAEDAELAPLSAMNAGLAAESDGRRDDAIARYRDAAALAAKRGSSTVAEKARQLIEEAQEAERSEHRDEAWRLAKAGGAELKEGRSGSAVKLLGRALDEAGAGAMPAGDRAEIEYALGHALLDEHSHAAAAAAFRRAVRDNPKDPDFHYMLALALYKGEDDAGAAVEFKTAIAGGIAANDAARARDYLAAIAEAHQPPTYVTVETQVSAGYDSNFASGRDTPSAGSTAGAPEVVVDVEPRVRLFGGPSNGAVVGFRFDALLYLSRDADTFTLIEEDLLLETAWSPRPWLTLSANAEGYFQTTGILHFTPYQAGAQLSAKALFLEGEHFATRLRYVHAFMQALPCYAGCTTVATDSRGRPIQDSHGNNITVEKTDTYSYMTGGHDDAGISELLYLGGWRLALGYTFSSDLVGSQSALGSDILQASGFIQTQRGNLLPAARNLSNIRYVIPYSYLGHTLGFDADGSLPWGLQLAVGLRLERRDYYDGVQILPAPPAGTFHKERIDDRLTFDASIKRELVWRLVARLSFTLIENWSNIANQSVDPTTKAARYPFDYDDKNYARFITTFDLSRPF